MLARTLKMTFWVAYDHLGKLILASTVCSATLGGVLCLAYAAIVADWGAPGVVIALGLLVLTAGGLAPALAAGLAHLAKTLVDERDGAFGDFLGGCRLYWPRAAALGALQLLVFLLLATSVWFYASMVGRSVPWLGYAISGFALWCLLFACATALLLMPSLVQKKDGVLATLKLSALLVLDNPLFCLGLMLQAAAAGLVSVVVTPVLFFIYPAAVMTLATCAYEQLAVKYDGEVRNEEEDDYLNRGFRDFLFPWKG